MKHLISERFATNGLLTILSLIVIFHLLIILRVIPLEIVWGGRLKNQSQMLVFETVSVTVNLIMLATVAVKANLLKVSIHRMIIKVVLWIMVGLFLINTVGNFFSTNEFEKIIFTPLTLLLAIFSLRVAIGDDRKLQRI